MKLKNLFQSKEKRDMEAEFEKLLDQIPRYHELFDPIVDKTNEAMQEFLEAVKNSIEEPNKPQKEYFLEKAQVAFLKVSGVFAGVGMLNDMRQHHKSVIEDLQKELEKVVKNA